MAAAKITLTKLDVARRQLLSAIDLYFREGDPVSIHTLTAAAYEILDDVAKTRGQRTNLRHQLEQALPPEMVALVLRATRAAQNFFKHADRDAHEEFAFPFEQTEYLLLDGCMTFRQLTGESPVAMLTFVHWFMVLHDLPYAEPLGEAVRNLRGHYTQIDRRQFYEDAMTVHERRRPGRISRQE